MRRYLIEWLGGTLTPRVRPAVLAAAKRLVAKEEAALPDSGYGENKRHRVYAQLIKDFEGTEVSRRELSLAIEEALWS